MRLSIITWSPVEKALSEDLKCDSSWPRLTNSIVEMRLGWGWTVPLARMNFLAAQGFVWIFSQTHHLRSNTFSHSVHVCNLIGSRCTAHLKKKWTGPASELLLRSNSRLKCILFFYSTVSTILWHFQTIPLMLCSTQLNFPHLLFSKSSFCSFVCKNNVKQTQQNRTTLSNNNKTKQNKKIPHLSKFFLK